MPPAVATRRDPTRPHSEDEKEIITYVDAAFREAESARRTRINKSRLNVNAYLGEQDFSDKIEGQSTEFIPKTAEAVERFSAFIQRGLTNFGDWYEPEFAVGSDSPLTPQEVRNFINCFSQKIPIGNRIERIETIIADAAKVGTLESLMGLKVHGRMVNSKRFVANGEDLRQETVRSWVPVVEPLRTDDYFPDPSGRNLYEIHETEDDWHNLMSLAADGILDKAAVESLGGDFTLEQRNRQRRSERERNQDRADNTGFRHRVVRREFWGTILDQDGKVTHENIVCEIDNLKTMVRPPEPNPFWHQESPFVVTPLIRVPFSVWHKALMDDASPLNLAINEVFNLMLDGGLASVWGIRQLKLHGLLDASQAASGIPQGETLIVNEQIAAGDKVLEQIATGQVPNDASVMLEVLIREFTAASLSNELQLGSLPSRKVLATEVNSIDASTAVTLDAVLSNIERGGISRVMRQLFLNLVQHSDQLLAADVAAAIGARATIVLADMTKAERFATFANGCSFRVHGLTATVARAQQFQRILALLQVTFTNPLLLRAFVQRFSADKILTLLMKVLSLNPKDFEKDADELEGLLDEIRDTVLLGQVATGGAGGAVGGPANAPSVPAQSSTDAPEAAQINQTSNPLTGLVGGEG